MKHLRKMILYSLESLIFSGPFLIKGVKNEVGCTPLVAKVWWYHMKGGPLPCPNTTFTSDQSGTYRVAVL